MSGFQLVSEVKSVSSQISNALQGSALLAVGLSYWQVFIGTLIGHLFGAAYVVAMSMPGLQYQISFPVAMRVAWGG
jgi:NCS1 family nucleobase:cation symporter-1